MQKDFIYENYLKMPDDLEFEQAMKVYEELLEENLEEDEIYDKLWDHALHCMIDYGSLRAHWKITPKTDRSNDDRTVMHDSVIHSLDELAAYTKEHGKEAKWREELGYQRKRIGDFACYVSLIYGVFAWQRKNQKQMQCGCLREQRSHLKYIVMNVKNLLMELPSQIC